MLKLIFFEYLQLTYHGTTRDTLKTKSWSKLVDVGQMGLKNESHLLELLVTWGS